MNGFVKVYDISKHEPKLIVQPKSGYDLFGNFGEIIMAKVNITATHMALTIATESLIPDGKLYIWDVERDKISEFDFMHLSGTSNGTTETNLGSTVPRLPMTFCWDNEDPRILACETRRLNQSNDKRPPTSMSTMRGKEMKKSPTHSVGNMDAEPDSQVVILFPTNDLRNIIKPVEYLNLDFGEQLIDCYTPYVVSYETFCHPPTSLFRMKFRLVSIFLSK